MGSAQCSCASKKLENAHHREVLEGKSRVVALLGGRGGTLSFTHETRYQVGGGNGESDQVDS